MTHNDLNGSTSCSTISTDYRDKPFSWRDSSCAELGVLSVLGCYLSQVCALRNRPIKGPKGAPTRAPRGNPEHDRKPPGT